MSSISKNSAPQEMNEYKRKRLELGLTVAELSELTGYSQREIQYIECGARAPSLETWFNLQKVFNHNENDSFYIWDGSKLRDRILQSKLTLAAFAGMIGTAPSQVSRWCIPRNEIGGVTPSISSLKKICYCLNTSPEDFFTQTNKEERLFS